MPNFKYIYTVYSKRIELSYCIEHTFSETYTILAVIAQETLDGDIASDAGITDFERGKNKKNKEAMQNYGDILSGASADANGVNAGEYKKPKESYEADTNGAASANTNEMNSGGYKKPKESYGTDSNGAESAYTNGMNAGGYKKPNDSYQTDTNSGGYKKPTTTKQPWTPKPYDFKSALGIKVNIIYNE